MYFIVYILVNIRLFLQNTDELYLFRMIVLISL